MCWYTFQKQKLCIGLLHTDSQCVNILLIDNHPISENCALVCFMSICILFNQKAWLCKACPVTKAAWSKSSIIHGNLFIFLAFGSGVDLLSIPKVRWLIGAHQEFCERMAWNLRKGGWVPALVLSSTPHTASSITHAGEQPVDQMHNCKYKHPATNTQPQINTYKYTHVSTQMQIHKYKYTNTNSHIQIH